MIQDPPEEHLRRPPWRRFRWQITAAVVIIAVAAGALLLAQRVAQDARPPVAAKPGAPASGAGGRPAGCRTDDADQAVPSTTPPDVTYQNVGAMLVPVSASAGPTHRNGPAWSCYAHTPMGAAIAAHVIAAQLATRDWRQVLNASVVDDAGRAAFIRASEHQTFHPLSPDEVVQPTGWQIVNYSPDQATVQTLSANGDGTWRVGTYTVRWDHGDWRLVMTNAGAPGPDPQTVASSAGFVRWPKAG